MIKPSFTFHNSLFHKTKSYNMSIVITWFNMIKIAQLERTKPDALFELRAKLTRTIYLTETFIAGSAQLMIDGDQDESQSKLMLL